MPIPAPLHEWRKKGVFFSNGRLSRGIGKIIRTIFFPAYSYAKLRRKPTNPGGYSKQRARRNGVLVDRQLQRCIPQSDKPCARALPETSLLFDFFNERFATWSCQYTVAHEGLRIGTRLDVIGQDRSGLFTAVEVKCGYAYRHCSGRDSTMYTHRRLTDAPVNHHKLQALIGAKLFSLSHGVPCRGMLVYVHRCTGLEVYEHDSFDMEWEPIEEVLRTRRRPTKPT